MGLACLLACDWPRLLAVWRALWENETVCPGITVSVTVGDGCQPPPRYSWVGRTARCPQFAGPFPYGPPPNRTCQISRHPALW
jgi:hypothetical protein